MSSPIDSEVIRLEGTIGAEGIKKVLIQGVGHVQVLPSFDRRTVTYEAEIERPGAAVAEETAHKLVTHSTADGVVRITCQDTRPRDGVESLPDWARNVVSTHACTTRSATLLGALPLGAALGAGGSLLGSAMGTLAFASPRGRIVLQRDEHILRIEDGRVLFDGREIDLQPARRAAAACVARHIIVRVPAEIAVDIEKTGGDVEVVAPLPQVRVRTDDGNVRVEGTDAAVTVLAFARDVEVRGAASVDIEGARDVTVEDVAGLTTIRDAVGEVQLTRVQDVQMQAADAVYIRSARNVTGTRVHGPLTLTDALDAHFTACDSDVELTRVDTFYIGRVDGDLEAIEVRNMTGPRPAA